MCVSCNAVSSGFGGSNDPNDFVAAYFEKSGSDDSALTFGSLKWQRRFFIFSDSQKMLYYFKVRDFSLVAYSYFESRMECLQWHVFLSSSS